MWNAIALVTSGLTLVAFIAAAATFAFSVSARRKERLIVSAPESERAKLVSDALEFFRIETGNLTKKQQFDIALEQIRARASRFKVTAAVIVVITVLLALLSAYAISAQSPPITADYKKLKLGASKEYVVSRLGPPPYTDKYEELERWRYPFTDYYLILLISSQQLVGFGLTSLSATFRPCLAEAHLCIGMTFSATETVPFFHNMSAKEYTYVERHLGVTVADGNQSTYAFYTGYGYDFGADGDCQFDLGNEKTPIERFAASEKSLLYQRAKCKVNGVGIVKAGYDAEDLPLSIWREWGDDQ